MLRIPSYNVPSPKTSPLLPLMPLSACELQDTKPCATPAPPCVHDCLKGRPCHIHALHSLTRTFSVWFGLRAGLSLAMRLRHDPKAILDLERLLSEKNLSFRVDAVRLGLFFGCFTGGFNFLHCMLKRVLGPNREGEVTLIAGFLAGLTIVTQLRERRRTLALYIGARLVQGLYNEARRREWIPSLANGDAALFIITSAQVMYAYVMAPETLPPSYWNFIVKTGPIKKSVLHSVRQAVRAEAPQLGCDVLHKGVSSCTKQAGRTWLNAFTLSLPLYASLQFVPILVLRLFTLFRDPLGVTAKGLLSAARSAAFLATFCGGYMAMICVHRNLFRWDHKFVFWAAGAVSSLSIFLEQKKRRSELALYVMPRAFDALLLSMINRNWIPALPHGDVLLFCTSTAGLMYFYHNHPFRINAPLITTIFDWLFAQKKVFKGEPTKKKRR